MSWLAYPFLLSVATTLVALYLRRTVSESPSSRSSSSAGRRPAPERSSKACGAMLQMPGSRSWCPLGIKLGENGSVYLVKGFPHRMDGVRREDEDANLVTTGVTSGSILGILTVLLTGKAHR